ncbi:uncharacterized protein LOC120352954 [Nilaparvata lugens]|uniref:uncharacterized protein LOC120352954 n=1 Tax=Nilaparvata lugens TaxID=108931 RepID=UPI00193D4B33|nr:uncharacterized protein LOC120352954 [Nilaparvata lugens]
MAVDIETMEAMFEKFKTEINTSTENIIKKEISALNIPSIIAEQNSKIEVLGKENEELKRELQKQSALIENMRRENNLIFFGVDEADGEKSTQLMDKTLDICNKALKVELKAGDINLVRRIGRKKDKGVRPVMLSLVSVIKKNSIMQECTKLKGSKIFLTHDLDWQRQKILREVGGELRDSKKNVKVRRGVLEIDG